MLDVVENQRELSVGVNQQSDLNLGFGFRKGVGVRLPPFASTFYQWFSAEVIGRSRLQIWSVRAAARIDRDESILADSVAELKSMDWMNDLPTISWE